GKLGLIASAGLVIYGLITLAIIKIIPVVLTLPGVAGFILSIGMAVDSNILIFERIKEELRRGNDQDIAIRLGFGRAIDAIKDANVTTLIVSFILFNPLNWDFLPQFGLVRGFALTLAIGVATSLFTGVVITRRLIDLFYKKNV
ncbi:MMPL family transporter, partial [Candidatus Roizmanbacteria bacterium]|nr:MMPL family transporter [Candidatus Roizmanbacteria bacterium]